MNNYDDITPRRVRLSKSGGLPPQAEGDGRSESGHVHQNGCGCEHEHSAENDCACGTPNDCSCGCGGEAFELSVASNATPRCTGSQTSRVRPGQPLAMVYAQNQEFDQLYELDDAMEHGTLFRNLDFPILTACGKRGEE